MFHRSGRALLILLSLCVVTPVAQAQTKTAAPASPSASNADIKTLLQLTGTDKLAQQMANDMVNAGLQAMKQNNPQMTDAQLGTARSEMEKLMAEKMPALMDQIVPIYAKHFTPADVKGLISFYKTPLGNKLITETPTILRETTVVGEQWGRSLGPEIEKRLGKALGTPAAPKKK